MTTHPRVWLTVTGAPEPLLFTLLQSKLQSAKLSSAGPLHGPRVQEAADAAACPWLRRQSPRQLTGRHLSVLLPHTSSGHSPGSEAATKPRPYGQASPLAGSDAEAAAAAANSLVYALGLRILGLPKLPRFRTDRDC